MIRWRAARRDDVAMIVALLADDMLGQGREAADLAPYLAAFDAMQEEPHNQLVVACDAGDQVVGCYQLTLISGLSLAGARRAQIEGVRIAASQRGQGLGAALLADAETRARAAGCALMQLTSNRAREDALRFYKTQGFVASHLGFKKPLLPPEG